MDITIIWENQNALKVRGAVYPDEVNGLPRYSIQIPYEGVENIIITDTNTTEYSGEFPIEYLSNEVNIISFRKMLDRGQELTFLDIIPIEYDSLTGKYYLIHNLKIEVITSKKGGSKNANLRTGEQFGNSVLASGVWYKIPVVKKGVHKIDYNYLKNTGLKMTGFHPKNIKIYGNGGGMLPQANSEERPTDLIENVIYVAGQSDGIFDSEDYILFYGQDADHHQLLSDGTLEYEKNFYSDTSFYFLTIAENEGLRINEMEDLGADHPAITTFNDFLTYEKEEYKIINSGRMWFGDKFDATSTYDLSFDFTDLVAGTELSVTSSILGQTYEETTMDLYVNSEALGKQIITTIAEGFYLARGSMQTETFTMNTSQIPLANQLTIRLTFNPVGSELSKAYLDYLIIRGERDLNLFGNQTHFRSLASIDNAISTFKIGNASASCQVWDVTNPLSPAIQKSSTTGNTLIFGTVTGELKEFIVFDNSEYLIPEKARKIDNQNLHATNSIDFIIITHPDFLREAERLADFRESNDEFKVKVVTTGQIYNEFSSGKQDVSAIRDFIKYIYDQGSDDARLQNVLLFGKGSFDYKDRIDKNTNFVPVYSSRNSLHPISSYSSDDYYTFMDEAEGEWPESGNGNHLMDIGVGRLPVKTLEEARVVVDKLINYSSNKETLGRWRNEVIFVADDGDNNLHQRDADKLATLVDTSYSQVNTKKIYIDAYEQTKSISGESAPGAKEALERSIDDGGLIVNFTGHGSPTRWTSETILNISSVSELENINRLPLFITATCEFGRHENPKAISGAEYLINNPNGGAIGLVTTSRPVYSSTNFILNEAFYENAFTKENGKYLTIGEVFRRTKNHPSNGLVNRNFALLADPSMTLAYAKDEIRIIADEGAYQPGDTLKALGKVKLKGEVLNPDNTVNTNFNGKLVATVFDKPTEIETFGHEDAKMRFMSRDNILFKGEVSVLNGKFEVEFIVPKNIVYEFDKGKISMYAYDPTSMQDAAGSSIDFIVGGESNDYDQDNTPPQVQLYINDTSFVENSITGPNINFLAFLEDESGISTSNSLVGQNITIILDDTVEVNVNQYYVAQTDTYKQGWVTYPFKALSIGTHSIRLLVWDVYNNFSEAEIRFRVVEGAAIQIENLVNYPNPFYDFTRFAFEHNRAGEDLEISFEIFSITGKLIRKDSYIEKNSPGRIATIIWDSNQPNNGYNLGGIYIFRLGVRSLKDGSNNFANHKFVKIN